MNEDEKSHQIGTEAETFLQFIQGENYFLKLMQSLEQDLLSQMMNLRPWQKDEFAVLKAQIENLYEPLKRVHVDIELGKQAFARMNGTEDTTQGIL
jgi:hypothetical protein